ncbi:MAG: hypothetical protein ACFFDU_10120 [Candidatus Thorarchaeota archaeon]
MTRFKYYTIYRCKNCGEYIRVHGKLTSKLVLPSGVHMCCHRPRLVRERHVLISEYKKQDSSQAEHPSDEKGQQKRLADYSE